MGIYFTDEFPTTEDCAVEWQELAAQSYEMARGYMWSDYADSAQRARRWQEHAALDSRNAREIMGIE